jgi:transcription elongation factor GreA
MKKQYLTRESLEKFKKELEYLKTVKRRELAKRLEQAISFGDLTENAAYHEAKESQAFLEGKILELEDLIRNAEIIQKNEKGGWIQIGSVVYLNNLAEKKGFFKKPEKFGIVSPAEADPFGGKISSESPLGKSLLDKPKGAIVEVLTPTGKIKYKILKIE